MWMGMCDSAYALLYHQRAYVSTGRTIDVLTDPWITLLLLNKWLHLYWDST